MEIPIHWRLKKQRYGLIGERCECGKHVAFPPRNLEKEPMIDVTASEKAERIIYKQHPLVESDVVPTIAFFVQLQDVEESV